MNILYEDGDAMRCQKEASGSMGFVECFQILCYPSPSHASDEHEITRPVKQAVLTEYEECEKPPQYHGSSTRGREMLFMGLKQFIMIYCTVIFIVSYFFHGWFVLLSSPLHYTGSNLPDLSGKFAVITGANTGIGKFTALHLVRNGCHVVITSRSKVRGLTAIREIKSHFKKQDLSELNENDLMSLEVLDLQNLKDVSSFSKRIMMKYKKNLDFLILNAGIMMTPFSLSSDGFESQFATNYVGHFLVVRKWMDWIRKSGTRVVSISSGAHYMTYSKGIDFKRVTSDLKYDPLSAYGQSKLANILFSKELAEKLEGSNATSNVIHPGMVQSELGRHIEKSFTIPMAIVALPILAIFELAKMSTVMGSLTQVIVATSPQFEGLNGKLFYPVAFETKGSKFANDKDLQRKLWRNSEKWVSNF